LNPPRDLLASPVAGTLPDYAIVEQVAPQLRELFRYLGDYVSGIEAADVHDQQLQHHIAATRLLLEQIYRQPITFVGEGERPSSVVSEISVREVLGVVKGIVYHGRPQPGEHVQSRLDIGVVGPGAYAGGVEVRNDAERTI
jgi:hypothetical protein